MFKLSWDEYFKNIARGVAIKSHCYSRQIGAVIAKNKVVISVGYNGPPMGTLHCETRHPEGEKECPRRYKARQGGRKFQSGENLHMCPALHAEENAIIFAGRERTIGAVLYLYGELPCSKCASRIINAGIKEVVCLSLDEYDQRPEAVKSINLFNQVRVKVRMFRKED